MCGNQNSADGNYSKITGRYTRSGEYKKLVIDVSKQSGWSGLINGFRFDYFNFCKTGDVMYIKSIELTDTKPITATPTIVPSQSIKPSESATPTITETAPPTITPDVSTKPTATVEITEIPMETEQPYET